MLVENGYHFSLDANHAVIVRHGSLCVLCVNRILLLVWLEYVL